ncbi:hypothetical protein GCM10027299_41560 [Larkinella ripae]
MRIAILQGAFLPVPTLLGGAVEKRWFALGKEFALQGHSVTQISRHVEQLPRSEMIDGVNHIRIDGYNTPKSGLILKFFDLLYTLKARRLFSADFDVVISNTFWAPIILPGKAKKICVVDVARMPKKQMQFYKQAARLRANSNAVAQAIKDELPQSVHNKVVMIPNPLPFVSSLEIDLNRKKPIILYVGRIHPEKGLDLLIKAYKKTSQNYRLQLVGPWETASGGGGMGYLNSLKQLAGDAPVEFIGPIFDIDKLNKYYQDASIFVYPSIAEKGETFGLAPLEAMAWGCVPIVSKLDCFQDFITDKKNGLIFDHRAENAIDLLTGQINRVQEDREHRIKLGGLALNVRRTHSTKHIAAQFLKEFERIVNPTN